MKTVQKTNKKNRKVTGIIVALVITLLIVGAAAYIVLAKPFSDEPTTDQPNTPSTTTPTGSDDENEGEAPVTTPTPEDSKTPDNVTVDDEADTEGITITTPVEDTTVTQGTTLPIRVLISHTGSGTCELVFSKDGESSITKTANIQSDAQSATCQGFNIDTNELSTGTWKATVSATINGQTVRASRDVTIGS